MAALGSLFSMLDLYLAMAVVLAASALLGWIGMAASRWLPYWVLVFLIAAVIAGVAILRLQPNRLWLGGLLPFSSLIVLGNITLPAVVLVCGMAFGRMRGSALRRGAVLAPLVLLAGYDLVRPMLSSPPPLGRMWKDGVCRQTSSESCSAASAATLLHAAGIETSEREMADLCLTRENGTSAAGIYRGLKLKTAGCGLRVEAFHCDIARLRDLAAQTPVLLTVELRKGAHVDPRYERDWGWTPGVAHTVVLFHFLPNGRIEIGDPDVGQETWNIEALRVLWHGDGIRIVRK
jgi:hypothetical protein